MTEPLDVCLWLLNPCVSTCPTCREQADRVLKAVEKAGYKVVPLEPPPKYK